MFSRDIKTSPTVVRDDNVTMVDLFVDEIKAGDKVSMGYAIFPPETNVDMASHSGDEYSYILEGTVNCESGGEVHTLNAGMAGFIPAGEDYRSFNDSDKDCKLIWMLIEK